MERKLDNELKSFDIQKLHPRISDNIKIIEKKFSNESLVIFFTTVLILLILIIFRLTYN